MQSLTKIQRRDLLELDAQVKEAIELEAAERAAEQESARIKQKAAAAEAARLEREKLQRRYQELDAVTIPACAARCLALSKELQEILPAQLAAERQRHSVLCEEWAKLRQQLGAH
jgi:hypothetical protein